MKAMLLRTRARVESAPLELVDLPDPRPEEGEVRVKIAACGVCRTDLHVIEGDLPPHKTPLIPGHQMVGRVDSLGPGATRFKMGDRVGISWLRGTCGACLPCGTEQENLCEEAVFTGHHEDGGYAELAVVREAYAYAIPGSFTDMQAAPLLCAGIIGYRALKRCEIQPAGKLGIFGFGSSAHVSLQVARHWGCDVYVFTRGAERQQQALALGAQWAGAPDDTSPVPLDGAILFAPAGELVPLAMRGLRKGGTLVVAGIHLTAIPGLNYEEHLFYEKTLTSVTANTRADGEALFREAARIPIRPELHEYPLFKANEALQDLKNGKITGSAVLVMGSI